MIKGRIEEVVDELAIPSFRITMFVSIVAVR